MNLSFGARHEVVVKSRHSLTNDVQVSLPPELALTLLRGQLLALIAREEFLERPRALRLGDHARPILLLVWKLFTGLRLQLIM